jgi:hypothetical protein
LRRCICAFVSETPMTAWWYSEAVWVGNIALGRGCRFVRWRFLEKQ